MAMIPAIQRNEKFNELVISTGNILNANNKLGSKSHDELRDGLKMTLEGETPNNVELNELEGRVLRATQELNQKITENERPEISIGAKIFLNKNSSTCIEQAINSILQILKVEHVDNVVLAYHPKMNSSTLNNSVIEADKETPTVQLEEGVKELWTALENFALQKKIVQLGIADLDIERLTRLCAVARVPPTIAQINLSSCCVVPPALQEFCHKHDIQLLTHSDPEILLPDNEFIIPDYEVDWVLRYQVHVRCRGVLTAKGYILGASKQRTTA